jgi:hypothetical protein
MVNCSATDILAGLNTSDLQAWYSRLAQAIGGRPVNGHPPMSSTFLNRYIAPRNPNATLSFTPPPHLKSQSIVRNALAYHRQVYLTRKKARIGQGTQWAGILPRWRNPGRYSWDKTSPIDIYYESLVEVPLRWQMTGGDVERDILYGLGMGFQLRTDVTLTVTPSGSDLTVEFQSFTARIKDRYDFNPSEHITVPNPDLGSTAAHAVCPQRDRITVYHKNAIRLEKAKLAQPYDIESSAWTITDRSLTGPATVTP